MSEQPIVKKHWFLFYWHLKLFIAHRLLPFHLKEGEISTSLPSQKGERIPPPTDKEKEIEKNQSCNEKMKSQQENSF